MDVNKINSRTLDDIKQFHELEDHTDGEVEDKLKHETVYELLDAFLTWHGIMGYTTKIQNAIDDIMEAQDATGQD